MRARDGVRQLSVRVVGCVSECRVGRLGSAKVDVRGQHSARVAICEVAHVRKNATAADGAQLGASLFRSRECPSHGPRKNASRVAPVVSIGAADLFSRAERQLGVRQVAECVERMGVEIGV